MLNERSYVSSQVVFCHADLIHPSEAIGFTHLLSLAQPNKSPYWSYRPWILAESTASRYASSIPHFTYSHAPNILWPLFFVPHTTTQADQVAPLGFKQLPSRKPPFPHTTPPPFEE
jgi:hypothetical protein